jgi:hypothetical protein
MATNLKYLKCNGIIRLSPYPFTQNDIKAQFDEEQSKMIKALVYDFLKKKRKLGLYYDCYVMAHRGIKSPETLKKQGLKPFEAYLEDAAHEAPFHDLRDFFFDRKVSFHWEKLPQHMHEKMLDIDKAWLNLIDKGIAR